MAATTEDLQYLLDQAWDATPDTESGSLRAVLRAQEDHARAAVADGSVSSISQNSSSQTYALGQGALSATDLARAWRRLINLFDEVWAAIASTTSITASDATTYAEMKSRLSAGNNPVYTSDFSCLRH